MSDFNPRAAMASLRREVSGWRWRLGDGEILGRFKHGKVNINRGREGDHRILLTVGDYRGSTFCAEGDDVGAHVAALLDGYRAYLVCLGNMRETQ